jgi:diacylglycerol kinase (ATP)
MRVLLLHNPKAGYHRHTAADLVKAIEEAGHTVEYASVKDEGFEKALEKSFDLVVAAGGDGTVGKVAKLLRDGSAPMAAFPLGTANNLARTVGYRRSIPELIAAWPSSVELRLDVGIARGPGGEAVFMESFGIGIFADLIVAAKKRHKQLRKEREKEQKKNGAKSGGKNGNGEDDIDHAEERLREDMRGLRDFVLSERSRRVAVELDGNDWSGPYVLVEAMNIPYIGPRLAAAAGADPGDGELDVVFLRADQREVFAEYLGQLLEGRDPKAGASGLAVRRAGRLRLVWDGCEAHIDGRVADEDEFAVPGGHGDAAAEVEITAEGQRVRFLAPAE